MSTRALDHIVHLTPPGSLKVTVEQWEKLGFKCVLFEFINNQLTLLTGIISCEIDVSVSPGGTHADGLTENALVVRKLLSHSE